MMTDESGTAAPRQYFTFGPFVFDVDKALKIIAKDPDRPVHPVSVAQWAKAIGVEKTLAEYHEGGTLPLLRGEIDEEYARTKADLSIPVIFADISAKKGDEPNYMLIDGTHRLRRAFLEGRDQLDAYVLDFAETRKIRTTARYGPGRRRTR